MEKVELKRQDVLREIVKTNRSNMPERINILSLDLNLQRNGKLKMTSQVLPRFYLIINVRPYLSSKRKNIYFF